MVEEGFEDRFDPSLALEIDMTESETRHLGVCQQAHQPGRPTPASAPTSAPTPAPAPTGLQDGCLVLRGQMLHDVLELTSRGHH